MEGCVCYECQAGANYKQRQRRREATWRVLADAFSVSCSASPGGRWWGACCGGAVSTTPNPGKGQILTRLAALAVGELRVCMVAGEAVRAHLVPQVMELVTQQVHQGGHPPALRTASPKALPTFLGMHVKGFL